MQSCVHSLFFFARPTDPPSREEGRWETKHFMGMALPIRLQKRFEHVYILEEIHCMQFLSCTLNRSVDTMSSAVHVHSANIKRSLTRG